MIDNAGLYAAARQQFLGKFLPTAGGKNFTSEDVYHFFNLDRKDQSVDAKHAMGRVLYELSHNEDATLAQAGRYYRTVEKQEDEIKWWENNENEEGVPLRLPLELERFCTIDVPALIVIAGMTNAGKTSFLVKTIQLNLEKYGENIHYFVSEGKELLHRRFVALGMPVPPPFHTYRRLTNFEDVIRPNALNLIDYIRVDSNAMYNVQDHLLAILGALKESGIAIVALQKPPGRDLAYGGMFTAFDPSLYIAIDKGFMRFVKIKTPKRQEDDSDPYAIKFNFKIVRGVDFYDVHETIE